MNTDDREALAGRWVSEAAAYRAQARRAAEADAFVIAAANDGRADELEGCATDLRALPPAAPAGWVTVDPKDETTWPQGDDKTPVLCVLWGNVAGEYPHLGYAETERHNMRCVTGGYSLRRWMPWPSSSPAAPACEKAADVLDQLLTDVAERRCDCDVQHTCIACRAQALLTELT